MGRRLLHDAWIPAAGEQLCVSAHHLGDIAEVVGDALGEPHHVGRVVDAALGLGLADLVGDVGDDGEDSASIVEGARRDVVEADL